MVFKGRNMFVLIFNRLNKILKTFEIPTNEISLKSFITSS